MHQRQPDVQVEDAPVEVHVINWREVATALATETGLHWRTVYYWWSGSRRVGAGAGYALRAATAKLGLPVPARDEATTKRRRRVAA